MVLWLKRLNLIYILFSKDYLFYNNLLLTLVLLTCLGELKIYFHHHNLSTILPTCRKRSVVSCSINAMVLT